MKAEPLVDKVSQYFPNRSKTCIYNLLVLSLAILLKETVCLNRLKGSIGAITGKTSTKPGSHYKRLIRIFDNYAFSSLWLELVHYAFTLLRLKSKYILLDGTSWQHGSVWHHYITLCIVYKGVGIPFFWIDLEKQGTSNFKERKKLMLKAMKHFNLEGKTHIADREYIGARWFQFLEDKGIKFVIRCRAKAYKDVVNSAVGPSYDKFVGKVRRSKIPHKAARKRFFLNGLPLYMVAVKNPDPKAKEPVILLVTNLGWPACAVADVYPVRWKIEHCFKHLKSNGFRLEDINLYGKARPKLLMAVVVFAYTLSVHEGLKTYDEVEVKTFADGTRHKAVSVFRHGLSLISGYLGSLQEFCGFLHREIRWAASKYRSPDAIIV